MRRIYLIVINLILILTSCDFGDTNLDPSKLSDAPVDQLLPVAEAQTARNMGSIGARISGVVVQHFTGLSAQPLLYNSYNIDGTALDDYWATGLYAGAMKDCRIIIEKGEEMNIPHYTGIAKILLAVNLGIATTFWGEVPYSEAFQGQDVIQPSYDSQESIYEAIQTLLDEGISDLGEDAGALVPGKDDLYYNGINVRWIGTARALKARYHMHLVNVDPEASAKALAALALGTISSNEQQAEFPFGPTLNEANPIAYYGEERRNQLGINPFLLNMLDTKNDPRRSRYTAQLLGNNVLYIADNNNLYWGRFESPMPLISYSELMFIRAEANLRLGFLPTAQNNLSAAIRANMEQIGITEPDITTYLASHSDITSLTTEELQLQRIMEEKYVAMFGQGTLEAWVDYRRTGYPVLTPAPDAVESFDPSGVIPRRYLYPISERSSNGVNVDAAIDRQGGHLLDQSLWAFPN